MAELINQWGRDVNRCCNQWLFDLQASKPQAGRFVESHMCPACKARFRVVFEYYSDGELSIGNAIGIESQEEPILDAPDSRPTTFYEGR
jgi:hypothetical protein